MTPDARFAGILDDLKMLGVTRSAMFGRKGMMADGKVIACYLDDSVAFKLIAGTPEHAEAMALAGADLWEPGGMGRKFKDWVRVPESHEDTWGRFAEVALRRLRQKL
jgi:hypothetical protein